MWKPLFDTFRGLLFLARDVGEIRRELEDVRKDLDATREFAPELAHTIERVSEREQHDREKLMLRIENALLKFERQLPPAKKPKKLR